MPEFNDDLTLVGGTFTDSGEGNVDFYTFWYSLCYHLGILDVYSRELTSIPGNEESLRRFLISKGVIIDNNFTHEQLLWVYNSWLETIKKRGTIDVRSLKGESSEIGIRDYVSDVYPGVDEFLNSGVGLKLNSLDITFESPISLNNYFSITFDTFFEGLGVLIDNRLFCNDDNWVRVSTDDTPVSDIISVDIFISINGVEALVCELSLTIDTLYKLQIVRDNDRVFCYLNGSLQDSVNVSTDSFLAEDLSRDGGLNLGDVKCDIYNSDRVKVNFIKWDVRVGSGFIIPSNQEGSNAIVQGLDSDDSWNSIWYVNPLFYNNIYHPLNAELGRLLTYDFGEFLFELLKDSELGLTIDVSSPISEEANCFNMNKLFGKCVVNELHKLPLYFDDLVKPEVDGEFINYDLVAGNTKYYGLNSSLVSEPDWRLNNDYKPLGLIPFLPIRVANYLNNFDGYEISFVIKSDDSIDLQFGIYAYDKGFNLIDDMVVRYTDDVISEYFFDVTGWDLCVNREVWVRGVFSPNILPGVDQKTNIGIGSNLYSRDLNPDFAFIVPFINARVDGATKGKVWIKDIVVRPLSLPTSKGIIYPKNEIILISANKSGRTLSDVDEELIKLLPYNSTLNSKFI